MQPMTEIDAFIAPYVGECFPAISLCVYQAGREILHGAWGWVDPNTKITPAKPDTRFDLASLTKLFTTTALLTLISEGKAELHTPLVAILPEFGVLTPRPMDGGQDPHTKVTLPTPEEKIGQFVDPSLVTLYHLLTHTSGLPAWRAVFEASGAAPASPIQVDPIPREVRWARALAALNEYAFVSQPGEEVRYSDIGLMLLGEAVTRLSGARDLAEAIQQRVLDPLGLSASTFNPVQAGWALGDLVPTEIDFTWRKRRIWGEVHDENADGVGGVAGHAGLFSTAGDVARFGAAWASMQVPGIAPELMAEATSEQEVTGAERRGLGWMIRAHSGSSAGDLFGARTYGHTGFTGTSLWIEPDKQIVVACMTNRVYYGREKEGIYEFRRALHDWLWKAIS